jgi:Family of unknown function (DUF6502)
VVPLPGSPNREIVLTSVPEKSLVPPAPQMLLKPLRRLLRPLVRLAIQSGVTFPVLADLLRGLFVEVAVRDVLSEPAARTDSRISLLTGVHRKEIRRLRLELPDDDQVPEVVTLSGQIIGRWLGAAAYTDAAGLPRVLARGRAAAEPHSFEALVESVTTDIRPRAVLDDFVAQGLVTLEEGDRVRLNQAAFVPRQGRAEQLFFFARNLHDHIAAAAANVVATEGSEFIDSSVHYDRLTPVIAARLMALAQSTAEQALLQVNRAALGMVEREVAEAAVAGPTRRVNFGIYTYIEDDGADTETLA